jgi:aryl-alcohol dehydrogenase-like predicted oxidoreductase
VGVTRLEQLDDAAAAVSLQLSPDDVAALEAPYVPHAVVGFS